MTTRERTKSETTEAKAKAKAMATSKALVDAKAKALREAGAKVRKANTEATAIVNRIQRGPVTIERLSPALNELENMTADFIGFASATGGLAPEFFIGYGVRMVILIGPASMSESNCGIWSGHTEGWTTVDGHPVLEVMLPPTVLGNGLPAIMAAVIHRIGHLINLKLGRDDVSKNGRHLIKFAETMKQFMVVPTKVSRNVQFVTTELSDIGMQWLERQNFSEATFTVFADKVDEVEATARTSKAGKANNDKASAKADKAKADASKALQLDKHAEIYVSVGCPVKAHRKVTGAVHAEKAKADDTGRVAINCGVIGVAANAKVCSKSLVIID